MSKVFRFSILLLSLFVIAIFAKNNARASNFSTSTDSVNKYQPRSNISKNDNAKSNVYVGIGVGTTGPSLVGAFYFNNLIGIRGEYSGLPKVAMNALSSKFIDNNSAINDKIVDFASENIGDIKISGVNLKSDFAFQSWGFDVSVRPFRGVWRIDAGVRNMDYRFAMDVTPFVNKDDLKVTAQNLAGDQINEYNVDLNRLINNDTVNVKASAEVVLAKGWKPYFGTGWDFNFGKGFTLSLDAGIVYLGNPMKINRLTITADNIDLNRTYIEEKIIDTVISNMKDLPAVPQLDEDIFSNTLELDGVGPISWTVPENRVEYIKSVLNYAGSFREQKTFEELDTWKKTLSSAAYEDGGDKDVFYEKLDGNELDKSLANVDKLLGYQKEILKDAVENQARFLMIQINSNAMICGQPPVFSGDEINQKANEARQLVEDVYADIPVLGNYIKNLPDISSYRKDADEKIDDIISKFDIQSIIDEKLADYVDVDKLNDKLQDINLVGGVKTKHVMKFWPVVKLSFGWRFNIG